MYHPPLPGPILRAPREGSHTEAAPKAAPQSRRAIMEGILAVSPSSSSVRGGGGGSSPMCYRVSLSLSQYRFLGEVHPAIQTLCFLPRVQPVCSLLLEHMNSLI